MSKISNVLYVLLLKEKDTKSGTIISREKGERSQEGKMKTHKLLPSRCGVNEVMMLHSSCLLVSFQMRSTCSLCRYFCRHMVIRQQRLSYYLAACPVKDLTFKSLYRSRSKSKSVRREDILL